MSKILNVTPFLPKTFVSKRSSSTKIIDEICLHMIVIYLKHSPNSGESVRKKVRVVRHVEVKILKQNQKSLKIEVSIRF